MKLELPDGSSSEAGVTQVENYGLSKEEKELCDRIGIENPDYCAAAVLDKRYSDKEVIYHEEDKIFEIDEEKMEMEFDIVRDSSSIVIEEDEDLDSKYDWISEIVITIEIFFELQ